MKQTSHPFRRVLLPAVVFVVVAVVHYVWVGLFPEQNPAQSQWATAPTGDPSWLARYLTTQSYWLGFSYALSLAFAATTFSRYREERLCAARNCAIGGVTLSGVLAVAGCYLIGCCGSPMLAVYLSLFGAGFLPFTKPLVAALATASILGAWWWLHRRGRQTTSPSSPAGDGRCSPRTPSAP